MTDRIDISRSSSSSTSQTGSVEQVALPQRMEVTSFPREISGNAGTLQATDLSGVICTNASGCSLTVDTNSPIQNIAIVGPTAGAITVVAGTGVTNDGTLTSSNGVNTYISILRTSTAHFIVGGNAV